MNKYLIAPLAGHVFINVKFASCLNVGKCEKQREKPILVILREPLITPATTRGTDKWKPSHHVIVCCNLSSSGAAGKHRLTQFSHWIKMWPATIQPYRTLFKTRVQTCWGQLKTFRTTTSKNIKDFVDGLKEKHIKDFLFVKGSHKMYRKPDLLERSVSVQWMGKMAQKERLILFFPKLDFFFKEHHLIY